MIEQTMNVILAKVGQDPEICKIPVEQLAQTEIISDLVEGNFGATEFFNLGNGVSLFILTNDLSIPLGLKPNRHFPGKDYDEIIFGNAIFIAAYNESSDNDGTVDMPEKICKMFIEQIKLNFEPCKGDEKADSKDEIYYENQGTPEERAYKWHEIEKPAGIDQAKYIKAGRAKWFQCGAKEVLEINDRYFEQVQIITPNTPLN